MQTVQRREISNVQLVLKYAQDFNKTPIFVMDSSQIWKKVRKSPIDDEQFQRMKGFLDQHFRNEEMFGFEMVRSWTDLEQICGKNVKLVVLITDEILDKLDTWYPICTLSVMIREHGFSPEHVIFLFSKDNIEASFSNHSTRLCTDFDVDDPTPGSMIVECRTIQEKCEYLTTLGAQMLQEF